MLFPQETDKHFQDKGATHYHDSLYPTDSVMSGIVFSRHYFKGGLEIGYVLPNLLSFQGHGIHEFETPRVWGIPHNLVAIK